MSDQRKKVLEKNRIDMYNIYGPIPRAIEYLTNLLEQHRDKENLQLDYEYECEDKILVLTHERFETDEELERRLVDEKRCEVLRRAQYERLRKEFESGHGDS